ncbi:MAG: 50S ribosome-binding GTPase, partial [Desulfobacterales bacterium]
RRLRFPRDIEVIITDTVGFIKDLPHDLMVAFRATLEELEDADLLLHIIDISNPRYEEQIKSVENILADLNLQHTPTIRALNKMDRVSSQSRVQLSRKLKGIAISARSKATLLPLIVEMEKRIE